MRPQSSVGFGENIHQLKNSDKVTFYTPIEKKGCRHLLHQRRDFEVESGASMHMMSRTELSSEEMDTHFAKVQEPHRYSLPMEKCKRRRKHKYYVHALDLFVTVQILEDTLAVPSLGKLCEDHDRPKMGRVLLTRRTISYLLSFQGYPPILEAVRPLHRYHKTR